MLTGPVSEESSRASRPPDLVVDEAQAPGLTPVAVDRQRLAPQRLHDEVRDDPAVAGREPGPVGVEDTGDAHVDAVGAVHGHGQALGEALGLVVDAARPGGVDVAPVATPPGGGPRDRRRPRWCSPSGSARRAPGPARAGGGCPRCRRPACRRAGPGRPGRGRGGEVAHGVDRGRRRRSSTFSLTLVTTRRKRSWSSRWATFSRDPLERSSRHTTLSPRSISRSHRCEPRKPAPPATTTRLTAGRSPCR